MNVGSIICHKIVLGVSLSFFMIKNCSQARGRLSSLKGYIVLLSTFEIFFPFGIIVTNQESKGSLSPEGGRRFLYP